MSEPIRLSNSTIKTFKSCRRRWYLTYERGLSPKPGGEATTGVRLLGVRIHAALEAHYGHGADPLAVLEIVYADAIEQYPQDFSDLTAEHAYARLMVSGYLEWLAAEGIEEQYEVIAVERLVEMPLDVPEVADPVVLMAKLDQVVRDRSSGALRFRDFKTVGSFSKADGLIRDEQLRTYDLLLAYAEPDETVDGALYTMILRSKRTAKATPPFFQEHEQEYTAEDRRSMTVRLRHEVIDMVNVQDAIRGGADHRAVAYPNPTPDCDWICSFKNVCPMFDNGSRAEAMLAEHFEVRDPYAYYGPGLAQEALEKLGITEGILP